MRKTGFVLLFLVFFLAACQVEVKHSSRPIAEEVCDNMGRGRKECYLEVMDKVAEIEGIRTDNQAEFLRLQIELEKLRNE